MKERANYVGKTGYVIVNGKKHFAQCIHVGRKGFRVKYNKANPNSCWMANDITTVREFSEPKHD